MALFFIVKSTINFPPEAELHHYKNNVMNIIHWSIPYKIAIEM